MIRTDGHLQRTQEALRTLEAAVTALSRDKASIHPDRFALMVEPLLEDIHRLRREVDEYTGVANAEKEVVPLWLRLSGPTIELGDTPSSIVTAIIDILRVGIQAIAEYRHRGAVSARPTAELKQACDLRLAGWAPGSLQIGLRLPEQPSELFDAESVGYRAKEALGLYLKAAAWVGSDEGVGQLEAMLPNAEQRRLILNQVARLVPRPRGGLDTVELSGRMAPRAPFNCVERAGIGFAPPSAALSMKT